MSEKPREEFIRAVFALAKNNPSMWADFLVAFNAYTGSELERATGTTTSEMAISLGMSRRMVELRNDFRDIEKLMEMISGGRRSSG